MFFSPPLLLLLVVVIAGWTYFFSTGGLHPAPARPFLRRLLVLLPCLTMAVQVETSEHHRATMVLVQW